MFGKLRSTLVAAMLIGTAVAAGAQGEGKDKDALARKVVEQFCKAFSAKDLDGMMNEADVPFCREGGNNIEKRDDLKEFLRKALEVRDPSKDTITIKLVTTLPELEKSEGKFTDAERKAMEAVLGKDHRVVKIEWNRPGERKHPSLILIRIQKDKAKVVGLI
jgi:hypothetical protein